MDIIKVVLQSFLSIGILFLLTQLTGRRSIHQLSAFDYINSITIGSIAAELATDLESWELSLTAMLIYGFVTALINWATCKSLWLRRHINGRPIILYESDMIQKDNLNKAKMDINEFLTQARLAGYFDLFQVKCAVMETNGQISFLPKSQQRPVTPQDLALKTEEASLPVSLIFDGRVLTQNLTSFGKDLRWLNEQLHAQKIGQTREVFYACCDENGNFRACRIPQGKNEKSVFEQ